MTVTVTAPPAPTLTLTANQLSVTAGATTTQTWYSTNDTTCTASGGWTGSRSAGGSESTGALSATTTYALECTGDGGTVSQSVTVTVIPPPAPTLTLTANPASVTTGGASTLTWSSTNATSCTASGDWTGSRSTGGSESTGALSSTTTYTLACSGDGGTVSQSVTVTVIPPPAPTLTLAASPTSVTTGGASTLTWSSTNATSCTASGGWTGSRSTSGSQSTGALSATTTYTLECTGDGGTVSQSVTVTVIPPPAPTLTLTASPTSVTTGAASTLTWSSTNATSCTASGGWTGAKPTSGSQSTGALSATSTYTLDCTGDGGTVSKSVTVTVTAPPAPTLTLTANPLSVTAGGTTTLTWSSTNATSCTARDGWSGTKPTGGTEVSGALSGTTSFTLECTGAGGSAWETATVTVVPSSGSMTRAQAFRFLNQASFGPTEASVAELMALGDPSTAFGRWIDGQRSAAVSLQLPRTLEAYQLTPNSLGYVHNLRRSKWFDIAINGPDQLRQRVAFALSEILVVSEVGVLGKMPLAAASYSDTLAQHAFGNFRELLEAVTLHPAMGVYLSMLGNRKPNPDENIRADENYAREVMQLFSIGLVGLNPDGTEMLDGAGQPIPTYDQSTIENFARVFTGWTYAGAASFADAKRSDDNQVVPMQAYAEEHDADAKSLLSYPGAVKSALPAGQSAEKDLEDALDNIFHHPNVGPYISKQLILRLVTSNPSPAYVARVTAKFNDDGTGQRGNLAAVVRAILLDPEARAEATGDVEDKLKEPLLRMVQFLRTYEARAASGEYRFDDVADVTGQGQLLSPSVFNFFSPSYAPAGEIADRGLVAPELEIVTGYHATTFVNYLYDQCFLRNSSKTSVGQNVVVIDIGDEMALAGDPAALVGHITDKLLGGRISDELAAEAVAAVNRVVTTRPADRVAEVLFLVTTSPEFATLR